MPLNWRPQLATQASAPPVGENWIHEIKHDGYRTLAFVDRGRVRFHTRGGLDWTSRYGPLVKAMERIPCKTAILDGEVAVPDGRGVTALSALQKALVDGRTSDLAFFAFDLCYLDGCDLSAAHLIDRKALLADLLAPVIDPRLRLSEHTSDGVALFARAQTMGMEGVIAKCMDAPYVHARASTWLKVKLVETGRFTIVGFIANRPGSVSSLILAEEIGGNLVYSGRAGAGLDAVAARELYACLTGDERGDEPVSVPRTRGARWVRPKWVVELGFNGRTARGRPRAPVILSGPVGTVRNQRGRRRHPDRAIDENGPQGRGLSVWNLAGPQPAQPATSGVAGGSRPLAQGMA